MRGVLLAVALAALTGCGKLPSLSSSKEDSETAPLGPPGPTVGAGQLYLDYGENIAAAEGKYGDKTVSVQGYVNSVTKGDRGYELYLGVYLDPLGTKPGTVALFRSAADVEKLKPLDQVTFTGRCKGKESSYKGHKGYVVVVENCKITDHKPHVFTP